MNDRIKILISEWRGCCSGGLIPPLRYSGGFTPPNGGVKPPLYRIAAAGWMVTLTVGRRIMRKILLLLFMTLAPIGAAFTTDRVPSLPDGASQEARNKVIAGRVFEEIFNQGEFRVADEIYARDFVNHGLHRNINLQEDQAAAQGEKKAFPDLKMTVNMMVAEGDLVTVVWTLRGTNTSAGYILPFPTGARIELRGITVWRMVDGKIREEWTAFDQLQVVRQFVKQLKWPIIGFLSAAVILAWVLCRVIRRLRRAQLAKATL
jgi:predicted ester cyclase